MTWTYTGRPDENQRDEVRFLVGDTCSEDPLAQDEEIAYALGEQPTVLLAAARVLYALAAKFSRMVTSSVGGVSSQCSDIAKAFKDRAKELDPAGIVATKGSLVLPSLGGRSLAEKDSLNSDTDAVQPSFWRGMGDIPGGPGDGPEDVNEGYDW